MTRRLRLRNWPEEPVVVWLWRLLLLALMALAWFTAWLVTRTPIAEPLPLV